jgi:hypothetical protein
MHGAHDFMARRQVEAMRNVNFDISKRSEEGVSALLFGRSS